MIDESFITRVRRNACLSTVCREEDVAKIRSLLGAFWRDFLWYKCSDLNIRLSVVKSNGLVKVPCCILTYYYTCFTPTERKYLCQENIGNCNLLL